MSYKVRERVPADQRPRTARKYSNATDLDGPLPTFMCGPTLLPTASGLAADS